MEESLGLGKKSYGPETDKKTWLWLPIPKPGFGRTLKYGSEEKGSSLCKCSILLGFIMSKNLRG